MKFIKEDSHFSKYYDAIYILFKTGLRISEFCGLTVKDIDFEHNRINVDHQLQRTSEMEYVIVDTKIEHGVRLIPMSADVRECHKHNAMKMPISAENIGKSSNDKNIIHLPRQVSWMTMHSFAQLGKVRHNKADKKSITTVSTTKAHRHNWDVSKCVGSIH